MKPDYLDQNFCNYLLPHEKETLKRCMAAQKIQGNTNELQIHSNKVRHAMKRRNFRNSIFPTQPDKPDKEKLDYEPFTSLDTAVPPTDMHVHAVVNNTLYPRRLSNALLSSIRPSRTSGGQRATSILPMRREVAKKNALGERINQMYTST